MSETQPKLRPHFQPPRERLAFLLAQLSELDPEPDKKRKLAPVPVPVPATKLRLAPAPTQMPDKKLKFDPEPNKKRRQKLVPARNPDKKLMREPVSAKKTDKKSSSKVSVRTPVKKPEPDKKSFHALLLDSAKKQVDNHRKRSEEGSTVRPWLDLTPRGPLGGLARIWSWLHSKYTHPATKRLRLSEVVSLGDKRFVALVKVEDREFLVGGAASSLSLLAQLKGESGYANERRRGTGVEGHSR